MNWSLWDVQHSLCCFYPSRQFFFVWSPISAFQRAFDRNDRCRYSRSPALKTCFQTFFELLANLSRLWVGAILGSPNLPTISPRSTQTRSTARWLFFRFRKHITNNTVESINEARRLFRRTWAEHTAVATRAAQLSFFKSLLAKRLNFLRQIL